MSTRPLKIIIFDGSFKTTPFINRLVKGLSEKHEVYILGVNEALTHKIKNVNYVSLGSNLSRIKFLKTTLQLTKVSQLIKTLKHLVRGNRKQLQQQNLQTVLENIAPDIIHLQWTSVIPWFETVLTAQQTPVVLSQRGYHSNVRPFIDTENLDYLKQWYPKIAGFHSVSKAIADKGDLVYQSDEKINQVIYTGLDIEKHPKNKTYSKPETFEIVSVGRPHWIKGYEYALLACKLLKEKGIKFKYTIIGAEGNEELQYLRHDLGVQNEIQLLERMPQNDVFQYMQKASVLVLPSLAEGVPNVVVEAMALGVPVISTKCGGVEELIENEVNGWLVPTRDPNILAEALIKFNQLSEEHIDKICVAAREKVEAQHSETKMITDMEALYKTVIKAKS
jgi:colanic acid/amylovoran biosynthesis glycosyltransferase